MKKQGAMTKGRRCATDTRRDLSSVDFSGDGKGDKALVSVADKKNFRRCCIESSMDEVATGYLGTWAWDAGVSLGNNAVSVIYYV